MAGKIPDHFIDQLLQRTDIVDVIGSRLQLRKAGREYQCRCPFHDEKSASFTVSPEKQFYHCFGCGAHGTAIGFLMNHDHLSFLEAVEELARRAGMELPERDQHESTGPDLKPIFTLLEQAANLYRQAVNQPVAQRYLQQRGVDEVTRITFDIGYAPGQGDFILNQLGKRPEARQQLLQAGLIAENGGRTYDRLRDRVVFPIRDRRGRTIGFGGRLLGEGKPKYLNSPETPVFHKGHELYGLYEALQASRKLAQIYIVEGYLDVVTLAQHGITNVVATLGTATTAQHIQLLLRYTSELVFCFDGDAAGRKAAWKALETVLPSATGHQSLKFLFLPDNEDPDSLVRRVGAEGFAKQAKDAITLSNFLFEHLESQVDDIATIDGSARFASLIQPFIAKMPAGLYRDLVQQEVDKRIGKAQKSISNKPSKISYASPPRSLAGVQLSLVSRTIAILLSHPHLFANLNAFDPIWAEHDALGIDVLHQFVEMLTAEPELNTAVLLERFREHPNFGYLQKLVTAAFMDDLSESALQQELQDAFQRLVNEAEQKRSQQEMARRLQEI